ncbi:MAG TPA: O-antigen polymerase [Devosia sp.]|nr:O-antigen polymerase [Devosia sp.]
MESVVATLGVLVLLAGLGLAYLEARRSGRLSLLCWTLLGVGGVYGACWAIVAIATVNGLNPTWAAYLLPYESVWPLHTAATALLVAGLEAGWFTAGAIPWTRRTAPIAIDARRLVIALWLLLVIAIGAQLLFSMAYGGLLGAYRAGGAIRAGVSKVPNAWLFLHPFGGFAIPAAVGFFGLILSRARHWAVVIGFIVALLFALYILVTWMGRIDFVIFILAFPLAFFLSRRWSATRLLLVALVAGVAIVVGAFAVSQIFHLKPASNLFTYVGRELSFPFVAFFAWSQTPGTGFRWFSDYLEMPIYYLPQSIWSHFHQATETINTTLILGTPKGSGGNTSSMPVDLLSAGYIELGFAGVPILGVFFGFLLRLLDAFVARIAPAGLAAALSALFALEVAVHAVLYGDADHLSNFGLVAPAILVAVVLKWPPLTAPSPRSASG